MTNTEVAAPTTRTHRYRKLAATGLIATVAAMLATTLTAALAKSLGVDFEIPNGGEPIPLPGFATMTALFSLAGTLIAAALLHWTTHPAKRFLQATLSLTAISLIAPLISGADPATTLTLIALHLIAASVVIPTLTRPLRARG